MEQYNNFTVIGVRGFRLTSFHNVVLRFFGRQRFLLWDSR